VSAFQSVFELCLEDLSSQVGNVTGIDIARPKPFQFN